MVARTKKVNEEQARQAMADYYLENKGKWPASIRGKREQIIELIMQGMTADQAFEQAARKPS